MNLTIQQSRLNDHCTNTLHQRRSYRSESGILYDSILLQSVIRSNIKGLYVTTCRTHPIRESFLHEIVNLPETRKFCPTKVFRYKVSYSHPDPQLPFYYYTSDHDSYCEGECPSFNKPSSQPSRLETLRPARHEQLSTFISGRVSLVVKVSLPIRRQFH